MCWNFFASLQRHPYLQCCSPRQAHWFCWVVLDWRIISLSVTTHITSLVRHLWKLLNWNTWELLLVAFNHEGVILVLIHVNSINWMEVFICLKCCHWTASFIKFTSQNTTPRLYVFVAVVEVDQSQVCIVVKKACRDWLHIKPHNSGSGWLKDQM